MENIDNFIIDRLGEHQRKIDFINRSINERGKIMFLFKRAGYTILSMAACLAAVFALFPELFKSNDISDMSLITPSFPEYRGASFANIESQISGGQYDDALSSVNLELCLIENELVKITSTEMSHDEKLYMTTLYKDEKEELLWSEIYILVKLNKKDLLKLACENYLNNNDFERYRPEVAKILKKIK